MLRERPSLAGILRAAGRAVCIERDPPVSLMQRVEALVAATGRSWETLGDEVASVAFG